MSDKTLSEAQQELVRAYIRSATSLPTRLRDIPIGIIMSLGIFMGAGGIVGAIISFLLIVIFRIDISGILMCGGFVLGAAYTTIGAGAGLRNALSYRNPHLNSVKDPQLARVIDTALVELPAGFEWTFEDSHNHDGTLGIQRDGDSAPIITVYLGAHRPHADRDIAGTVSTQVYVNSTDSFTTSLNYAASLLHEFFLATKQLSKDPVRVGGVTTHTLRIQRVASCEKKKDTVTGHMWLVENPDKRLEISTVVVMQGLTENLPMRLVAAVFPAWVQFHHQATQADTRQQIDREQKKSTAARQFLLESALKDIRRSTTPTDDELLDELG